MRKCYSSGALNFVGRIFEKDWNQHFNTKILHFSKAFNPKILEWRHFFNLESFVKLNHLGKFLKEVESDFL